jgi:hypothetical protein
MHAQMKSTTISKKEAVVNCLCGGVSESMDASNFFFDLTELDNT